MLGARGEAVQMSMKTTCAKLFVIDWQSIHDIMIHSVQYNKFDFDNRTVELTQSLIDDVEW